MVIFHSMSHITFWILISALLLLWVSTKKNPFVSIFSVIKAMVVSRKYLIHVIVVVMILLVNKLELIIELAINTQPDYTTVIHWLEGNFVATFQQWFESPPITIVTSIFYLVIFPALMIVSLGLYTYQRNYKLFYAVCYAILINYIVAIPFYLFFPVSEVWSFDPQVKLLILNYFPTFETDYRPLSGLDNCFPSLHTSISVTLAAIACKSGNYFWSRFAVISCGIIIFSIFYLGIHWVTDMCAGVLLGLSASALALRIVEGRRIPSPLSESSV